MCNARLRFERRDDGLTAWRCAHDRNLFCLVLARRAATRLPSRHCRLRRRAASTSRGVITWLFRDVVPVGGGCYLCCCRCPSPCCPLAATHGDIPALTSPRHRYLMVCAGCVACCCRTYLAGAFFVALIARTTFLCLLSASGRRRISKSGRRGRGDLPAPHRLAGRTLNVTRLLPRRTYHSRISRLRWRSFRHRRTSLLHACLQRSCTSCLPYIGALRCWQRSIISQL